MKTIKFFIIPFILAIIVFYPTSKVSAYSLTIDDDALPLYITAVSNNSPDFNYPTEPFRFTKGSYGDTVIFLFSDFLVSASDDVSVHFYRTTDTTLAATITSGEYARFFSWNNFYPRPTAGSPISLTTIDINVTTPNLFINPTLFPLTPPAPDYDYFGKNPLELDIDGFLEWLELYPEFADIIINNTSGKLDLSESWKMNWLLSYYDNFGMYSTDFYNYKDILSEIGVPDALSVTDMDILRNVLKMQYNKYINSKTPSVVEPTYPPYTNNNPVTIPDDTLNQPIIIQNNNDFNYFYLREIIRLITNDINNDYSYHYENKNLLNNIVSGINDLNFTLNTNILPIINGIANLDANLNLLVPVINSVNDNLTNLISPITNMGDKLNDISLKLESGGSGNCNYDESFWELMLVPTFDEFDEIHAEFISKFPIVNEIATISLDGDIPTIENKFPDKELDNLIEGGLVPVAYASDGGLPSGQNPYGFSYSESEITSSDLFTFTMPTGTNSWLDKFNGMEISLINFKKFNTAIQFFKGVISVLAVFAFTKWLLNFVPKLATGASTGDG